MPFPPKIIIKKVFYNHGDYPSDPLVAKKLELSIAPDNTIVLVDERSLNKAENDKGLLYGKFYWCQHCNCMLKADQVGAQGGDIQDYLKTKSFGMYSTISLVALCTICTELLKDQLDNKCLQCGASLQDKIKELTQKQYTILSLESFKIAFDTLTGQKKTNQQAKKCNSCAKRLKRKQGIIIDRKLNYKSRLAFGVEIETIMPNKVNADIFAKKIGDITPVHDGSVQADNQGVHRGIEFITNPCDIKQLKAVLIKSFKAMQDSKMHINNTCSLHVHVSFPENHAKIYRLLQLLSLIEPIVYAMMKPERINLKFSRPLYTIMDVPKILNDVNPDNNPEAIKTFLLDKYLYRKENLNDIANDKNQKYGAVRYCGFNLHSIFFRGTIEWRQHEGTLDYAETIKWVFFINRFIRHVLFSNDDSLGKLDSIQSVTRKFKYLADVIGIKDGVREYYADKISRQPAEHIKICEQLHSKKFTNKEYDKWGNDVGSGIIRVPRGFDAPDFRIVRELE